MKFPSLSLVLSHYWDVAKRYPFVAISAVILAVSGFLLASYQYGDNFEFCIGILFATSFAFPLMLSLGVFAERHFKSEVKRLWVNVFGVAVSCLLYAFYFRDIDVFYGAEVSRMIIVSLLSWFSLLILPVWRVKEAKFWRNTVVLAERFLKAFVIFGALYLGFIAFVSAVDVLFGLSIGEDVFMQVWFLVVGLLAGPYFAAVYLEKERTGYPKWLEIAVEYVATPLSIMYLLLLYVYSAKIVATWQWPEGGVAIWVLMFSVAAVVTHYFSYSLKIKTLKFVEIFRKYVFYALIPLQFVLFGAAWVRIAEYGVTIPRYYVVLFGVWMLLLSVYYVVSKAKNVQVTAYSLFVALVISILPFVGAQSVDLRSQLGQLGDLLIEGGYFVDGEFVMSGGDCAFDYEESDRLHGVMYHVWQYYGAEGFDGFLADESYEKWLNSGDHSINYLVNEMGCYSGKGAYHASREYYYVERGCGDGLNSDLFARCAVNVADFDYYFDAVGAGYRDAYDGVEGEELNVDGEIYLFRNDGDFVEIVDPEGAVMSRFDLEELVDRLGYVGGEFSRDDMVYYVDDDDFEVKFIVTNMTVADPGIEAMTVEEVWGELFVNFK